MNNALRFSAGALALGLSTLVESQVMAAATAGAKAPVASLAYRSAFADYKAYHDVAPGDWRALNDTLRDSGDGPMNTGSMNMSHDLSIPAGEDAPNRASPSSAMHRDDAHPHSHKTAHEASSPVRVRMDDGRRMPGAKP